MKSLPLLERPVFTAHIGEIAKNHKFTNPYKYGYQNQEKSDASNPWYSFELRNYNQDLGRWFAPDPYGQHDSPYMSMANNPISFIDPDGGFDGGYKSNYYGSGTSYIHNQNMYNTNAPMPEEGFYNLFGIGFGWSGADATGGKGGDVVYYNLGGSGISDPLSIIFGTARGPSVGAIDPSYGVYTDPVTGRHTSKHMQEEMAKWQNTIVEEHSSISALIGNRGYLDVTKKFNAQLKYTKAFFESKAKAIDKLDLNSVKKEALRLLYFTSQVKTKAPFDLKQPGKGYSKQELKGTYAIFNGKKMRFDDFGNYNYGVAAKAFGFDLHTAILAAGLNQISKEGIKHQDNPGGFYDDARDTEMIIEGFKHFD